MVVLGWCLLLRALPLEFSLGCFWLLCFVTTSTLFGLPLILPLLFLWVPTRLSFVVAPASRRTCMSESAIAGLTLAINRLAAAIEFQASSSTSGPVVLPDTRPVSGGAGDIKILYPATVPFPLDIWIPHCNELRFRGADTGPPEVPDFCLNLVRDKLGFSGDRLRNCAASAFDAGFWARASLDCHIPYQRRLVRDAGEIVRHIVVFRSTHCAPFRVTCWQDLTDLCDVTDSTIIYEAFSSYTEVQVFCAGAGFEIPDLKRWIRQA